MSDNVLSEEILNQVITAPGTFYSRAFKNYKRDGFCLRSDINDGGGNLVGTPYLQSYDSVLNKWADEPKASFDLDIDGTAKTVPDTFTDTHSEEYRVKLVVTAGAGQVTMVVSENQLPA